MSTAATPMRTSANAVAQLRTHRKTDKTRNASICCCVTIAHLLSLMNEELEQANLTAVDAMIQMIDAFRTYEMSQRMMKAIDETLDKVVNDVAATS